MAQSGYTPLLVYGSSTAAAEPTAPNLTSSANGAELALNYADGKLFYKNSGGNVRLLAIGYGASTVTPTAGGIQYGTGTAVAFTAAGTAGYILQSNGASAPSWVAAPSTSPGGSTTQVQYNNAGAFGGSANFVWDNSNVRLGIGTSSPATKLDVRGTPGADYGIANIFDTTSAASGVGGVLALSGYKTTTSGAAIFAKIKGIKENATAGNEAGALTFETNSGSAYTERMRIDSAGLVGIGTTTPNTFSFNNLVVASGSANAGMAIYGTGQTTLAFATGTSGGNSFRGYIQYTGGGTDTMAFGTAANERMRINAVGQVGVGTTNPSTQFVVSNNGANGIEFDPANAKINSYNRSTSAFTSLSIDTADTRFLTSSTERARFSSAGGFSVGTTADPGAGAIYATGAITAFYSDRRLKDVKGTIANALDKVSSLSGVYYTNNEVAVAHGYTSAETQVGLLAQDVEAVLPEVVKAAPFDLDEKGNSKSGEHYKTIQYERIIPLLVEAIKELRAEVQALRG